MKIAVFSTKDYDRRFLTEAQRQQGDGHVLTFFEPRLTTQTAGLAHGYEAVCAFVNDRLDQATLTALAAGGTRLIALRSAGYNHVDLPAAKRLGLTVTHVPGYSPHAVAEHTLALILALNRHIHRAHNRVREGNFSISGFIGFDLHGKTAGLIGTGRIGTITGKILQGFGCTVLAYDPQPPREAIEAGFRFLPLAETLAQADVVTLHCPLVPATRHIINRETLGQIRRGAMLINTSRGGVVDTPAAIEALLNGQLGYLGIDVYEEEADLFYEDRSDALLTDAVFSRLLTLPNVLVTSHQAFFTREALTTIAKTTLQSVADFEAGRVCAHSLAG